MLAEFAIIEDPLRPSVTTNLCAVCFRHEGYEGKGIGCCSYEPEFCLFDLVFLYLRYPELYQKIKQNSRIINGFNGVMAESSTGVKQCPFVGPAGCLLPREALTPLCRLYLCREAALFAPAQFEQRFDAYFTSREYRLNQWLNARLPAAAEFNWVFIHRFVVAAAPAIHAKISGVERTNPPAEQFSCEVDPKAFGIIP